MLREHLTDIVRLRIPVEYEEERTVFLLDSISFRAFLGHRLYPVFDASLRVVRVALFSRDISLQKRLERSLKENVEQYYQLFKNMPNGMLVHDYNNRIIQVNELAVTMLGQEAEELIGASIDSLVPEQRQRHSPELYGTFKHGVYRFNTMFRTGGGRALEVEVSQCHVEYMGTPAILCLFRELEQAG